MPKFTVKTLTPEEAQVVWQAQSRLDPDFATVYQPMLDDAQVGDTLTIDMTEQGIEWMTSDDVRDIIYNLNEAAKRRTRKVSLTVATLSPEETAVLNEAKAKKEPYVRTYTDADGVVTERAYVLTGNKWVATVPDAVVLRYKKSFRESRGTVIVDGKEKEVKQLEYSKIQFRLAGLAEIKHRAPRANRTEAEQAADHAAVNGTADTSNVPAPFEAAPVA